MDFGGKNVQILNKKLYNKSGFLTKMVDFWGVRKRAADLIRAKKEKAYGRELPAVGRNVRFQ